MKNLTERELSVLKYLALGFTNKEISEVLNISVHTTKAHLESKIKKLEVKNRVQAVMKAVFLNIIEINSLV